MGRKMRFASAFFAGMLALVLSGTSADAQITKIQQACFKEIAKQGRNFVKKRMKEFQKCNDKELKATGACAAPDPAKLQKIDDKLTAGLAKKCSINAANFANMGFPGQCDDPDPGNGFVLSDLQACILESHTDIVDALLDVQYDPAVVGPLDKDTLKCQREISKSAGKFIDAVVKNVQKCRLNIFKGKIVGVLPVNCATADPKTAEKIAKAEAKAEAAIAKKCLDDTMVTNLLVCEPDQTEVGAAADCIVETHRDAADNPDPTAAPDLIDYEFASPGICGDNRVNSLDEECDGTDDADCPGECGASDGFFACLCGNVKRQRVVEHANADLDNGWTGRAHDSGIVEGGGYVIDLLDCDGVGDFDCLAGPHCSLAPFSPCNTPRNSTGNADTICANLGQGTCRKGRTATGPHCFQNVKQACINDAQCSGAGDFCVKKFHGAPLPLSAAGVSVCVLNIFTEDVVGTTNLLTGSSSVSLRQNSVTHLGPALDQPCPVCGGFCSGSPGTGGPGARTPCSTDADCSGSSTCVTDFVCSYGPNVDQACRPNPPSGGPTDFFGNPSVDCPPFGGANISGNGLDIHFNPASTGTVTRLPSFQCDTLGFNTRTCRAALDPDDVGRSCTTDLDCPGGGVGSCSHQCFCPTGGGVPQKPNDCEPACVGGSNDAGLCASDPDCPGGFCHNGDCRVNPSDTDSAQEGLCTVGPATGSCSVTKFKGCNVDAECDQTNCTFCEPGETCVLQNRQCFVNTGIVRTGAPGVPDKTTAATFCIAGTSSTSINSTAGLPGPGAITNPVTTIDSGF